MMTPETHSKLADELDAVEGVIFHLQQRCETEGARQVKLAPHDNPNVKHIREAVTIPGDEWQTLEALKGLTWVLRQLCDELREASK
jgi:hypothetical protein